MSHQTGPLEAAQAKYLPLGPEECAEWYEKEEEPDALAVNKPEQRQSSFAEVPEQGLGPRAGLRLGAVRRQWRHGQRSPWAVRMAYIQCPLCPLNAVPMGDRGIITACPPCAQASFNATNMLMGVGILSLPYALKAPCTHSRESSCVVLLPPHLTTPCKQPTWDHDATLCPNVLYMMLPCA